MSENNFNQFIWQKKNCLTPEFCNHLISKFEKDNRSYPGVVGRNLEVRPEIKSSLDLNISRLGDWKNEDHILFENLTKSLEEYEEYIQNQFPHTKMTIFVSSDVDDSGYQIQRTKPGEYYTWHDDQKVDYDLNVRTLTYIWYLNTITEGGYTEFYDGTKIHPECGKLLIFPATWTFSHRGVSPKSETKYICTGWMRYKLPSIPN
jgi:Rps23 Pro-64 3,4-dihydroxylase Tpa1-like proline 4-hydroxylase